MGHGRLYYKYISYSLLSEASYNRPPEVRGVRLQIDNLSTNSETPTFSGWRWADHSLTRFPRWRERSDIIGTTQRIVEL